MKIRKLLKEISKLGLIISFIWTWGMILTNFTVTIALLALQFSDDPKMLNLIQILANSMLIYCYVLMGSIILWVLTKYLPNIKKKAGDTHK